MQTRHGFTLIELMITLAIVAILSAIAIPQFANLTRKSHEATTKANLGVIRSALSIYYGDMEGWYPTDDLSSLIPKYLAEMPYQDTMPYHRKDNTVGYGDADTMVLDRNSWFYFSVPYSSQWGQIVINCIHQDLNGRPWSTY